MCWKRCGLIRQWSEERGDENSVDMIDDVVASSGLAIGRGLIEDLSAQRYNEDTTTGYDTYNVTCISSDLIHD